MAPVAAAIRDDQGARGASSGEPPPLGRAGPTSPGGAGARRWPLLSGSLRVQFTLFALAVLLVASGLFGWVFWRISAALAEAEAARYTQLAADVHARLDQLQSRDRERLVGAAFSNELYELTGRGPAARDSMIHPAFTEAFARQHGDRFIGIYDLTGRRLFAWSDPASGLVESEVVS